VDALHPGKYVVLAIGVALFAVHAGAYGAWLIDDAGISIAYATNFAHGLGLVSQPGAPPVEGYTNALWVFLLALLSRMSALTVPGTLKLLGGVLVAASYATLLAIVQRVAVRPLLVGAAVLVFTSANPSFVIWCMSGLENALYTFTIILLAYLTLRALEADRGAMRPFLACALVAVLVATTRPDGVLFALLPPGLLLVARKATRQSLLAFAVAFAVPLALFLGARLAVFHHLVPNTYVAKGGIRLGDALDVPKLEKLLDAAFASLVAEGVFLAALVAAVAVARRGRLTVPIATVIAFAIMALADFMLLPKDRMDENRFGTPFYPLVYAALFTLLDVAIDVPGVRRKELAVGAIAASLFLACAPDFAGRALVFARAPSIGLFYVRRAFAERIDRYAETLHVDHGSVLLPDVGGMLLWSHLRVVDLAGLCDERLAQTLQRDPVATREYVLGQVRPTFIHAADIWAKAAALEEDPRFATDYAAIHRYTTTEDPPSAGHAAGLFVRRDALDAAGGETALEPLRRESHFRLGFLPPAADSGFLRWLDATSLVPRAYRARLASLLRDPMEGAAK
jgi:hypothetical protein